MVRSRCGIWAVVGRGGCRQVSFGLPAWRTQVLARKSSGTCFGREQVPCLLLDQRSHLTEPEVAAPAPISGPAARTVRRTRPVDDRPWPRGARRTPHTPGQRPSMAPRCKTYAAHAQLVVVGGPAARNDSASRQSRVDLWPGGASRTGNRRSHHPNPHFAPTDATSHQARLVRRRCNWCEVGIGGDRLWHWHGAWAAPERDPPDDGTRHIGCAAWPGDETERSGSASASC